MKPITRERWSWHRIEETGDIAIMTADGKDVALVFVAPEDEVLAGVIALAPALYRYVAARAAAGDAEAASITRRVR